MPSTLTPIKSIDFFTANESPDMNEPETKVSRRGNALMKKLDPSYLSEPHPLDFFSDMPSDQFCFEKAYRQVLEPLEFKTKKEWLSFCEKVWTWAEAAEQRELEAEARDYLEKLKANPKLYNLVKANLSEPQG